MKTLRLHSLLLLLTTVWLFPVRTARAADCTSVPINAIDHGWYDANGQHLPSNENYFCGSENDTPHRNWFAFSIPATTQQVVAASLRLYTFSVVSPQGVESYELRHVSTPVGALRLGGGGLTNIYADLGDGALYGARNFINAEVNLFVTIPLNAAFLANLNAAAGGTLALGGQLTTLNGGSEYLFGSSSLYTGGQYSTPAVQLLLTYAGGGLPVIQSPPLGGTFDYGTSHSLQAQVCGSAPLTVQWLRHGTNVPGATNFSLPFNGLTTNDAGPYQFVASNASGSVTSAVAQVNVNFAAPQGSIYLAAGSSPNQVGASARLCASLSAIPAAVYQWQFHGTNLAGQNGVCLDLPNLTTNQAGAYRLVASNAIGSFTSAPVQVDVAYILPTGYIYLAQGSNPALAGGAVIFCSAIQPSFPLAWQWQFNGTNLAGQTTSCLTLNSLTTNHAGSYRLVASNAAGFFTSAPIALAVEYQLPSGGNIYVSSGSSPAPAGTSVTLCAARSGAPYPSAQWQFNGVNLPGQVGGCLALGNVTSNQAGTYRFVVSNILAVTSSPPFTLAVNYLAPTGNVFFSGGFSPTLAGSAVTFCANVAGAPSPSIQWQHDGTNLPGVVGSCVLLPNLSSNEAGLYRIVLSNSVAVFTSAPVALAVSYVAPTATLSSSGVVPPVLAGSTLTLCSTVTGSPAPTRQWYFNGTPLAQFGQCLQISNVSTNQSGSYHLVASNVAGLATSAVALVSVVYAPPTVSAYLSSGQTPALTGGAFTLCASVGGWPPLALQWRLNGTNLPGEFGSCLTVTNAQPSHAGDYTVMASNFLGLATGAVVRISVVEPSAVRVYYAYGAPVFQVGAAPTLCSTTALLPPFTWQWRFNGADLPGETNVCLNLSDLDFGDAGDYALVVTDGFGSSTSPPVALTVYLAPPQGGTPVLYVGRLPPLVGDDVALSASHYGSPAYIQWRFNGVNLPGQTNILLSFFGVTTNQSGNYSFVASNAAGAITSSVVSLNVGYQAPAWQLVPQSQTVAAGGSARFPAYARGGPAPDYALLLHGTNVAVPFTFEGCCGPNAGGFTLLDVSLADAGDYVVTASNFLGVISSPPVALVVTPAGPLDQWTQRHPLPQSQILYDVTRGPGRFVAVGEHGTILTAADGSGWALQNRRVDLPLYGVAYGAGLFVAVGEGGTILSSPDGTNWAYRFAAPNTFLNDITFADGRFLAVGTAPGLLTVVFLSTDGVNWGRLGFGGAYAERTVTHGNGLFVAAGLNSIRASADGTNWSTVLLTTRTVESVTYANGFFVAVGENGTIHVSANGTAWQTRAAVTTRRLLGVTYGAGKFVAVGTRGTILTSPDTLTWTPANGGTFDRLESVTFADGEFVAVGENGSIITSTNGTAWTQENIGTTRDLDGMEVSEGLIVVVGKGGSILTSTDGAHYTLQNAGVTNDLHGVTRGGGLWVAVGEPGIVLTSPDAVTWTPRATGSTNSLKGVTYAAGRWIAVGTQGAVATSTNGADWTVQTIYSGTFPPPIDVGFDLNAVAYGNGGFTIVGDGYNNQNGSAFRSSNGVTWARCPFYPGKNLRGVTVVNGLFLVTANDGYLFHGGGFNFQNTAYLPAGNLRGAAWVNGRWVVVGNGGAIFTSTNLVDWERRASRTFENFHGAGFLDGKFVVIGNRGTVLQSGRFLTGFAPPRWQPGVGFTFGLQGVIGRPYVVESSPDLLNWIPLLHFTNQIETTTFTDTNALQQPRRFYRVLEP